MWFVFPQLRGIGRSETARFYGIADAAEARAWLAHPLLGPRLAEAARAMLGHRDRTAGAILGPVDAMKLRSSMTLFPLQPGADPALGQVLAVFFDGARCAITVAALGG